MCADVVKKSYQDVNVHILSTIDFVKEIAKKCGWDGTKTESNREFLHRLKEVLTDWNDVPNKKVVEEIKLLAKDPPNKKNIFFVDIREKKNIERFSQLCKSYGFECFKVLVKRSSCTTNEPQEIIDEVNSVNYDTVIYNDYGLDELRAISKNFINVSLLNSRPLKEFRAKIKEAGPDANRFLGEKEVAVKAIVQCLEELTGKKVLLCEATPQEGKIADPLELLFNYPTTQKDKNKNSLYFFNDASEILDSRTGDN